MMMSVFDMTSKHEYLDVPVLVVLLSVLCCAVL